MNIEAVSHDQHVLLKKIHRKTPYPCSLRWNKIARKTGLGAERVKLWFETYNTLIQEKKCKAALKQAKPLAKKAAVTALTHGINCISNSQGRRTRPMRLKRQRPIQPIRRKPKRSCTVKNMRRVDVFDIDSKLSNITLNESTSKKGSCQCEFESDLMSITITFSLNTI